MKKADMKKKEKKKNEKKNKKKYSPVIRKLRIEFITVMMTIVLVFLAVIFGVQYFSSKRSLENESRDALEMSLGTVVFFQNDASQENTPGGFPGGMKLPEDVVLSEGDTFPGRGERSTEDRYGIRRKDNEHGLSDFRDRNSRTPTLIAIISKEDSVTVLQNNIFFIDESSAEELIRTAASEEKELGTISDHDLRYMKRSLDDGATAVAFVDTSGETTLLRSELTRSLWISLSVISAMFLLSLFLSKLTIRPVERAWEDQRRFVADASHELKTPLTVIMSNTDMVQRSLQNIRGEDTAEGTEKDTYEISTSKLSRNLRRMENVHEESLRMKELIGELLEIARGDVGQNTADFTDVSLSEIVNDALLNWESVYFEQGKLLTGNVEDGLTLHGDHTTLRRLTEILIDNALKYSKESSEVTVTLKKEKNGSRRLLHLSVSNEGQPLTEEEISHLFDRFYRADSSREKTAGYGLGLSIASSIVEAHKGRLWAEADGTRGNIFHVTFPV